MRARSSDVVPGVKLHDDLRLDPKLEGGRGFSVNFECEDASKGR